MLKRPVLKRPVLLPVGVIHLGEQRVVDERFHPLLHPELYHTFISAGTAGETMLSTLALPQDEGVSDPDERLERARAEVLVALAFAPPEPRPPPHAHHGRGAGGQPL